MTTITAPTGEVKTTHPSFVLHVNKRGFKGSSDVDFDPQKLSALYSFKDLIAFEVPKSLPSLVERAETLDKVLKNPVTAKEVLIAFGVTVLSAALIAAGIFGAIALGPGTGILVVLAACILAGIALEVWNEKCDKKERHGSCHGGLMMMPPITWIFPFALTIGKLVKNSMDTSSAKKTMEEALPEVVDFYNTKGSEILAALQTEIDSQQAIAADLARIPADPYPNSEDPTALQRRAEFVAKRQQDHQNTMSHIQKLQHARSLTQESIAYCRSLNV